MGLHQSHLETVNDSPAHVAVPSPHARGRHRCACACEEGATHRGSVSAGHPWEAWFAQGTLEQSRDSVSRRPRVPWAAHLLYVPPRLPFSTGAPRTPGENDAPSTPPSLASQPPSPVPRAGGLRGGSKCTQPAATGAPGPSAPRWPVWTRPQAVAGPTPRGPSAGPTRHCELMRHQCPRPRCSHARAACAWLSPQHPGPAGAHGVFRSPNSAKRNKNKQQNEKPT